MSLRQNGWKQILFVVAAWRISSPRPLTGEILSIGEKQRCNYQVLSASETSKSFFVPSVVLF